jgi:hypothetical protein
MNPEDLKLEPWDKLVLPEQLLAEAIRHLEYVRKTWGEREVLEGGEALAICCVLKIVKKDLLGPGLFERLEF